MLPRVGRVAHSQGRAQGGPPGSKTRGSQAPFCRDRGLPAAKGWAGESEGAKVPPEVSGMGEAEFNGGKEVGREQNKSERTRWKTDALGNFKQKSNFLIGGLEQGRWLTFHRKSPQHLSAQRMLQTEIKPTLPPGGRAAPSSCSLGGREIRGGGVTGRGSPL